MKAGLILWTAEEMRIRRLARLEGNAEMIKNFLSVGTPIDLIIKASGWTKEKILELAKKENIKVEEI